MRRIAAGVLLLISCYTNVSVTDGGGGDGGGPPHTPIASVSVGDGFACLLSMTGELACWGRNTDHEVNATSDDQILTPSVIAPLGSAASWKQVAAGGSHACAIAANDTLWCWGLDTSGQRSGTASSETTPTQVGFDGVTQWSRVATGATHTCAITTTGSLYCWGDNSNFELGVSASITNTVVDVQGNTGSAISDWTVVAAGLGDTCAVSATFGMWCWGVNEQGQLGNGTVTPVPGPPPGASPMPLAGAALTGHVTSIGMTSEATCVVTDAGLLYCWGFGGANDLANLGPASTTMPQAASGSGWTRVESSASQYLCGLQGSALLCWGQGNAGGLGQGQWFSTTNTPTVVPGLGSGVTAFSVGFDDDASYSYVPFPHTSNDDIDLDVGCAVVGGSATCWGDDRFGELGNDTSTRQTTPAPVQGLPAATGSATLLAVAGSSVCAARGSDLYCWGEDFRDELTDAASPCPPNVDCGTPLPRLANLHDVTELAAGLDHTCAIDASSALTCWGNDDHTQLGASTMFDVGQVVVGGGFSGLIVSYDTVCANATSTGEECFGNVVPYTGAAPGSLPESDSGNFDGATALAMGATYGCQLTAGGTVECIGDDTVGEFGAGAIVSNDDSFAAGPGQIIAIDASKTTRFVCGVETSGASGAVGCWGDDTTGALGTLPTTFGSDFDSSFSSAFYPIGGASGCTAVAANSDGACAICGNGAEIDCWGGNRWGTVGDGAPQTDHPIAIHKTATTDTWIQIGAGINFTCAVHQSGEIDCWGLGFAGELGNGATAVNTANAAFVIW